MQNKKLKILIIGGDSFIANIFISNYLNKFNLTIVSRRPTGINNEFVINDFFKIPENLFINTDAVINFAAIVHREDIKDQKQYYDINFNLALLNCEKSKKSGVKLFVQFSTIAVYGSNVNYIDIDTLCKPDSFYGQSKYDADKKILEYQSDTFNIAIIRPPMVYGGGGAPGNMLKLIKLVDIGIPMPFKGVGNVRNFINVNNLIQYLNIIIEKNIYGVFLVSDLESISTEDLIRAIGIFLNRKILIIKLPSFFKKLLKIIMPHEYDKLFGTLTVKNNFPNSELIREYNIHQGIKEMVDWYLLNKNSKGK